MAVSFTSIDVQGSDRDEFIRFMTRSRFPFHVVAEPTADQVNGVIDGGRYDGPEHAAYWVDDADAGRIGVAVLEDLTDSTPMFDLRLADRYRGHKRGVEVLRGLTTLAFESAPHANRFEGHTREDNIAMRKTFLRAGFLKEAHYREGWPQPGGAPLASVAYAILRRDWSTGEVTQFDWDDLRI